MSSNTFYICLLGGLFCFVVAINVANSEDPTLPPVGDCVTLNQSCSSCLRNVSCLWCGSPQKCMKYPVNHILPTASDCALASARWGVCWLNFEALIISMSIIGGVLLISVTLCCCKCCGCCCFKKNNSKYLREEARLDREKQERQMRQDERRQDRQRKNDDIRRKYGLLRSDYQRLDGEM